MPFCENPLPRASSHNCEELRKQICPQCYIRIYRERAGKPGRAYKMYKNMLCANLMCRQLILNEKPQSVLHVGRICGSCHNNYKLYLQNYTAAPVPVFLRPVPQIMSPALQMRDTVIRSTRKSFRSSFTIEELLKPN
ncbi:hypothetical protein GCK72_021542 [Caenorhabditis remanei]|uniref:Uncharacterized protein n=1 Tax=Caenorhabditis remanei TaxID=31234 RepID=A0A6A5GK42_CAERE|nr:hypothetical protein GCK72_021542 [Caenorhabditis remanei]KAF1754976.1 hypothetical protein GCK72_021542 [Caenorhabditis remanei]